MKTLLFILFFCCLGTVTFAQNEDCDSISYPSQQKWGQPINKNGYEFIDIIEEVANHNKIIFYRKEEINPYLNLDDLSYGNNITHPETLFGETFLTNISLDSCYKQKDSFVCIPDLNVGFREFSKLPYKTKRMGKQAYDWKGFPIQHSIPVFIQKKELQKE